MATSETAENQVSALNDLIKINNDRAAGYQKALENTQEADLKALFPGYVAQSKKNSSELEGFVKSLGGKPADSTSIAGDLHHAWIDVKGAFTSNDRHAVLAECESGEDVAKKAYKEVLGDTDISWDANISTAISSQNQGILSAHNEVKALRDAAKS